MNTTRHLVWHDLSAQRVPFAMFAVLLAVEAALTLWGFVPSVRPAATAVPWIPLLRLILASLLTALVIQRDSLVGTTAFWRTRPIGRGLLLASKSLTLGLTLVAVPASLTLGVWLTVGLPPKGALIVAGITAAEQGTVVLLTAMAAVVTQSLTQLVVAGVAGATLVTVFNGILLKALLTTWPFIGQSGIADPAVYLGTLFAIGLPTVAWQYLRPREWRTAALVATTLLIATVLTRLWPTPIGSRNTDAVDPAALKGVNVSASLREETLSSIDAVAGTGPGRTPVRQYSVEGYIDGDQHGLILEPEAVDSKLLLRDRTVQYRGMRVNLYATPPARVSGMPFRRSQQAALGGARLPDYPTRPALHSRVVLLDLPRDIDRQYAGTRGILTSDFRFSAHRFRTTASTPVRIGARLATDDVAYEIVAVQPGSSDLLAIRRYYAGTVKWSFYARALALRNLTAGEAYLVNERSLSVPTTLQILRRSASYAAGFLRINPNPAEAPAHPLDAAWLANAELVLLETEALGGLTLPAQMEIVVGGTGSQ